MDVEERKREYKRALNDYKSHMRRVKEDNWKQFVSESSNLDPWGPVYKVCRGKTARQGLSALCVNGNNYSTWNECAEVLLERFFAVSCLYVEESVEDCVNVREDVQVKGFEWQEVNVAVKRGKLGKTPGLDGLTPEMLRVVWSTIPGCLMTLYDACLTWMFSECVEESVCDCAAEVSREAANGPRELQANQLAVR